MSEKHGSKDLSPHRNEPKWAAAHRRAVERGERHYRDPESGYMVFTELEHKNRGNCCGSGCRHCPYGKD